VNRNNQPKVETYLSRKLNLVVIIPLGAIEQHGVQLPLGTDSLAAIEICKAIAKKTDSLVLPITWVGYSEHHLGFKGTIAFSQDTLIRIIIDTIGSLSHHGVKRILLVNFHGGNTVALNFAVKESSRKYQVNIISNSPENQDPFTTLKNFDIHAGKEETLFMLNLFPELVDKDKMIEWKPTTNFPKTIAEARKLCLGGNNNCQQS
jgi:creatinine amidohydrolase